MSEAPRAAAAPGASHAHAESPLRAAGLRIWHDPHGLPDFEGARASGLTLPPGAPLTDAVAALAERAPWGTASEDRPSAEARLDALGVGPVGVLVLGRVPEPRGLLFFRTVPDLERYEAARAALFAGEEADAPFPPCIALGLVPPADGAEGRWTAVVLVTDDGRSARAASEDELALVALLVETFLSAIAAIGVAVAGAWSGGRPAVSTVSSRLGDRDLQVAWTLPACSDPALDRLEACEQIIPLQDGANREWMYLRTCPIVDCDCREAMVALASTRAQIREAIPLLREAFAAPEEEAPALPLLGVLTDIDTGEVVFGASPDAADALGADDTFAVLPTESGIAETSGGRGSRADGEPASVASRRDRTSDTVTDEGGATTGVDQGSAAASGDDQLDEEEEELDEASEHLLTLLDGALLERLGRLWLTGKGLSLPSSEPIGLSRLAEWKPGDTLTWSETHEEVRTDLYASEDRLFAAEDVYCVDPACDCKEVIVEFLEISGEEAEPVGAVVVTRSGGATIDGEPDDDTGALLAELWDGFTERHGDYPRRLFERRRLMRKLGERLHERAAAKARPPTWRSRSGKQRKPRR